MDPDETLHSYGVSSGSTPFLLGPVRPNMSVWYNVWRESYLISVVANPLYLTLVVRDINSLPYLSKI